MLGLINKKAKLKNCLGIFLSVEYGVIADIRQEGKTARIARFVRVPFPQIKRSSGETTKMSTMNAEFLENEAAWVDPLKKALADGEWSTKNACISLSSQFSVVRHFVMPMVAPRFRKQSIPFESKKYVPFPFEESFYDYYAYSIADAQPAQASKGRMGVVFALTNKRVSQALVTGMEKLGLELHKIESAPVSVSRIYSALQPEQKKGPQALAHFNPSTACITIYNEGVPVLFREVNFGDSQSTERRRLDLKGSIDFVSKQFGGGVSVGEVTVSGENLELWKNLVAEETKLPVVIWDPSKAIGAQETEWGLLAATGAGGCAFLDYPADMDLRGAEKGDLDEKTTMFTLWAAAGSLVGILLLLCAVQYTKLFLLKRELTAQKNKTDIIQEFEGKTPEEIMVQAEAVKNRSSIFTTVLSNVDYLTPKLEALVNVIPENVWIKAFSLKSPLKFSAQIPRQIDLTMSGSAQTGTATKDIALLNQFREDFKSQKNIADTFAPPNGKCDISIQTMETGKASRSAVQETVFNLACTVK
ncbi:MAG: pilus assembly protein PilM [Elusimicrobia bacterium]|nr:pilus assembly protein PilM [Elusimicrobiota bacterium]